MIEPGDEVASSIDAAIAAADVAVVLVTGDSAESAWVRWEWQHALASCMRVIPVVVESTDASSLPAEFRHIRSIRHEAVDETVRQIRARITATIRLRSEGMKRLAYFERPYSELRRALSDASVKVCFAGNSFDGATGMLPPMLHDLARRVDVRLVLPDPVHFDDWLGGRDLELAARARAAIDLVRASVGDDVSLRLAVEPITQALLIVDGHAYMNPLKRDAGVHGLVRVSRGSSSDALFREAQREFETRYSVAAPGPFSLHRLRKGIPSVITESHAEVHLVAMAERYLESQGFTTVTAQDAPGRVEYDIAMLDRTGRLAVAEVKLSGNPVGLSAVRQLVRAAKSVGADLAFLFGSSELTASARTEIAAVERSSEIRIEIVDLWALSHPPRSVWLR